MLKRAFLYATLLTLAFSGQSFAQTAELSRRIDNDRGALLTEITDWLAANFDFPARSEHPRIAFASPLKLAAMRYKGLLSDGWREDSIEDPAVLTAYPREVVAIYNDTTKTIVLAEDWAGVTPADLSVLVHEMVHHLQNLSGLKYDCPAAREKLAYKAQNQWLQQFGLNLETTFEVDLLTILVRSTCAN